MIQINTRYFSYISIYQELIGIMLSLSRFAFLRYMKPDVGLIQNFQISLIGSPSFACTTIFVAKFIC